MRAVFFDLDGPLLRGTTISVAMAEWLDRAGELDALERDYTAGRVSNARRFGFADAAARAAADVAIDTEDLRDLLQDGGRAPFLRRA